MNFKKLIILIFIFLTLISGYSQTEDKEKPDFCGVVRNKIIDNFEIPKYLMYTIVEETVEVQFTLNRDGKLVNKPIILPETKSIHNDFNTAAIECVIKASETFPPLPKEYKKEDITFIVPLRYSAKK